ncbi:hypothetical protein ACOMHN_008159 [Nucella lapillus]
MTLMVLLLKQRISCDESIVRILVIGWVLLEEWRWLGNFDDNEEEKEEEEEEEEEEKEDNVRSHKKKQGWLSEAVDGFAHTGTFPWEDERG